VLRRKPEPPPPLDRRTVDGIIRMLMDINAKLDRLLDEEEDEEDGPGRAGSVRSTEGAMGP
jgi:hypothetical protein